MNFQEAKQLVSATLHSTNPSFDQVMRVSEATAAIAAEYVRTRTGTMSLGQVFQALRTTKSNRDLYDFLEFMGGQTVVTLENGETGYFTHDVSRFLNNQPVID